MLYNPSMSVESPHVEDRLGWEKIEQEIQRLSEKIDHQPDIIVGVVRGGLIPARLLSTSLKVKDMYCLTVQKVGEERRVTSDITEDISGKGVLLVEDALETGRSLVAAEEYLAQRGAHVKTACLYTTEKSEISPDYSLEKVTTIPTFPWE